MSIYLTSDLDLQFAAHGLVGVNYFNILNLFMAMDSTANAMDGDDMSLLSEESVSESVSSLFAEELGEGFVLNKDITQAIKKQIDLFVDAMKTEGGRRLTFGGLEPFLSACFCDYTDDAISCDAVDENGVLTILGGDSLFTTGDLNLSGRGPVPYYASVSAACFDDINGQGHVSETTGGPPFFECYSNNRFGHSHGGKFEPVSRVFLRVVLSTIS